MPRWGLTRSRREATSWLGSSGARRSGKWRIVSGSSRKAYVVAMQTGAARFGGPMCLASHLPACFVLSLRPTRRPPEAPGSRPHPPLRKSRLRRGRNQPTPRESLTDPVVYDLLDWIRGLCSIKEGPVQFLPFPSVPFRFFYWMA